jgi:hypothetical protein
VNGEIFPPQSIPGVKQYRWEASSSTWRVLSPGAILPPAVIPGDIGVACSDETTPLEPGLKLTLHAPFSMDIYDVKLGCNLSPTGGNLLVDVRANGESIFFRGESFGEVSLGSFGERPYINPDGRIGGDQAYFIWNWIKEGTELTYHIISGEAV